MMDHGKHVNREEGALCSVGERRAMSSTACGHLHFCHRLAGIVPNMVLDATDLQEGSTWPCCWSKLRHLRRDLYDHRQTFPAAILSPSPCPSAQ